MSRRNVRKLDPGFQPARMKLPQGFNADFQQREDCLVTNRAPRRTRLHLICLSVLFASFGVSFTAERCQGQDAEAIKQAAQPAVLLIQLPADAELELMGQKTTSTGTSRRFKTPPLTLGSEYDYPIKATWKQDGQQRTVERILKVRGGVETPVNLLRPAGWPPNRTELRGRQEVRVRNPNGFHVVVALRAMDGRGKDFTVGSSGIQSVYVPNGRYDIFFQYSEDPEGLYQGDSFTLSNNGVEIQLVKVVDGNYSVRRVN